MNLNFKCFIVPLADVQKSIKYINIKTVMPVYVSIICLPDFTMDSHHDISNRREFVRLSSDLVHSPDVTSSLMS